MSTEAGEQVFGDRLDEVLTDKIVTHSRETSRGSEEGPPAHRPAKPHHVGRARGTVAGVIVGVVLFLVLSWARRRFRGR